MSDPNSPGQYDHIQLEPEVNENLLGFGMSDLPDQARTNEYLSPGLIIKIESTFATCSNASESFCSIQARRVSDGENVMNGGAAATGEYVKLNEDAGTVTMVYPFNNLFFTEPGVYYYDITIYYMTSREAVQLLQWGERQTKAITITE
jgi:hypothetical protein